MSSLGEKQSRIAALEAAIREALNAMTRGSSKQILDVVHSILHADPSTVLDQMIREAKAEAWDEGFDAGEKDAWDVDVTNEKHVCTPNPYRNGDA